MTSHKKVLRVTAFHALASCYPDLHRPAGPMDENEILLRASEELVELRKERDLWNTPTAHSQQEERTAAAFYLRRYAVQERKRAQSLRADAGTQAEPEARGSDRVVLALEGAAEIIEQGRHWR